MLASASPRRLELLRLAGLQPTVRPSDVDEATTEGEPARGYVARVARAKALAAGRREAEVVLAADTTVVIEGRMLGKPADTADGTRMLRSLAGRPHTVMTGVTVVDVTGRVHEQVVTTEVVLAALTDEEIDAYVASGEPEGKAGGYAIQGRASVLVERICGSWTNVVGLPVVETVRLLREAGLRAVLGRHA